MYESLPKIDMSIFEAKRRYGAIAVEVYVLFEEGRETVIRLYAVKGTVYVFWDCACSFELEDVGLETRGFIKSLKEASVWEFHLIA